MALACLSAAAAAQAPSPPARAQLEPLPPLANGALLRCGDLDVSVGMEGSVLALVAAGQRYPLQQLDAHRGIRYQAMDDFRTVLWDNDGRAMLVLGGQILPECTRRDLTRKPEVQTAALAPPATEPTEPTFVATLNPVAAQTLTVATLDPLPQPIALLPTKQREPTPTPTPPPLVTMASAPQSPAPSEPPPVAIATLTTSPALPAMRPRAPAALPSLVAFAPATRLPPAVQPEAHREMPPPLMTTASAPQTPAPVEPPPVAIATLTTQPALPAMRPRAPAALPSLVAYAPATLLPPAVQPEAHPEMLPPLVRFASRERRGSSRASESRPILIASLATPTSLPPLVAPLPGPRRFFPRRAELPTVARRALAPGAMIASFQRPRRAQRSAAPSQAPPLNNAMAVGFAPQWTLKMRDGLIMFSSADGTNFNARSPAPFESAGVRSYAATSEGRLLHVAVYERPCADAASGQTLATTVIVRLDGKTFNGCGAAGISPQQ